MYLSCPCLCLHVRTVLVPLHNVYRACTPCTVFWHGQHGQYTYLARTCACTYELCLYHCTVFWYRQPGQFSYLARLRELLRAMILVFGLTPRYYTVDPMLLPSGNPFKCHEKVLYFLQPMIPPKRFDIFSPDWGMLRRFRCVQIFL